MLEVVDFDLPTYKKGVINILGAVHLALAFVKFFLGFEVFWVGHLRLTGRSDSHLDLLGAPFHTDTAMIDGSPLIASLRAITLLERSLAVSLALVGCVPGALPPILDEGVLSPLHRPGDLGFKPSPWREGKGLVGCQLGVLNDVKAS